MTTKARHFSIRLAALACLLTLSDCELSISRSGSVPRVYALALPMRQRDAGLAFAPPIGAVRHGACHRQLSFSCRRRVLTVIIDPPARPVRLHALPPWRMAEEKFEAGRARGNCLPKRLDELAQWVGASKDGKEAGLRLVKLGDDFARANGESLSPALHSRSVKVPGCVSVVRIAANVQQESARGQGTLQVYGEADARVARGMLALLAEGLRGADIDEVLCLDVAELVRTARLQQFLPPGRNNGLGNMLAVIQNLAREHQAANTSLDPSAPQAHMGVVNADKSSEPISAVAVSVAATGVQGSREQTVPQDISVSNFQSNAWAWGGRSEEVAMLLSGGVDSSVAMALLKDQGYKVTAFYLKIWLEDELAHLGECPWEEDWGYASSVAKDLGVQLEGVSLQREYWDQVVKYLIDESRCGRTPNPDIMCNSRIKFGMFHDYVGQHFSGMMLLLHILFVNAAVVDATGILCKIL